MQGTSAKKMIKYLKISICVFLCSCCSRVVSQDHIPSWDVRLAMPMYYRVAVLNVYGVNNDENWTVPLIGLGTSSSAIRDIKYVRHFFSPEQYDGLGLVLDPLINGRVVQPQGTSIPPDSVYVKWVSWLDNTLYYTKIHFSDDVMKFMNYQEYDNLTHSDCYHNTIVLGFLPNSYVKTWLYGCGRYTYISEQKPEKIIKTKVPNEYDPKDYSDMRDYLIKKAKKEKVSIIPIPWDKVNKVTIPIKNYRIENFSDIDKSSFQ